MECYIGFIIFSMKAISSAFKPYLAYNCWSISATDLLQSISDFSVKSCRGISSNVAFEMFFCILLKDNRALKVFVFM